MRLQTVPIIDYGQLKKGDKINLLDGAGRVHTADVKEVICPGTDREEIIICKKKNLYFITDNYLRGTSWVKECTKVSAQQTDT